MPQCASQQYSNSRLYVVPIHAVELIVMLFCFTLCEYLSGGHDWTTPYVVHAFGSGGGGVGCSSSGGTAAHSREILLGFSWWSKGIGMRAILFHASSSSSYRSLTMPRNRKSKQAKLLKKVEKSANLNTPFSTFYNNLVCLLFLFLCMVSDL